MEMVDKVVSLPKNAAAVADGLEKFILAVVAAHKAGGGAGVELPADLSAAVADLIPVVGALASLPAEASGDLGGFAEAFVLAGFGVEKALAAK